MKEEITQLFRLVNELRERVEQLEQGQQALRADRDDLQSRMHETELSRHRPDCRCADCEG